MRRRPPTRSTNLENAILNLTMTNIRSVMGSMDLDELLSNRDEINQRLLKVVDAAVSPWGLKITRIEIKDIDPPKDLVEFDGPADEGRARKARADPRGRRQAAGGDPVRPKVPSRRRCWKPKGRREAAFRDAEARERSAEAEAKATQVVSDAIAAGDVQAINYFVANNYIKALEAIAKSPNQKVLMMPVEAASVIGAIGGIAEIAKETFGGGGTDAFDGRPPSANRRTARRPSMELLKLIAAYGGWAWVVGGLVLLALELVVPGGVFVWLGASAVVTGLLALLMPIGWPLQFLIFGVLALLSVYLLAPDARQGNGNRQPVSQPPGRALHRA